MILKNSLDVNWMRASQPGTMNPELLNLDHRDVSGITVKIF